MVKLFYHKHTTNMNIIELFDEIQDRFTSDDLNGELILQGNCIIWTYTLDEELDNNNQISDYEDDDIGFSFNSSSSEELLNDAYTEDCEKLETFLEELNERENWSFSDSDTLDNVISFKIF